ncbi:MAG: hypothetical protein GIKADHBN_03677 [Phycisphaerales bacterium]|nr:hypothetical protein [Phycisphaerales bacterium]
MSRPAHSSKSAVKGQTRPRAIARGPHVLIRRPVPADRREFIALRTASARFLLPWEPSSASGKHSPPGRTFSRILKTTNTETNQRFLVCDRSTGAIMGLISLNQIFRGPFQSAYTGYWIAEPYAGKGFMTQALSLVLTHAFTKMKLHRIEANLMPRNQPSRALVKKLGFRFEGLAKRYLQIAGRWEDHEHWAITAEEWHPAPSRAASTGRRRTSSLARARTMA